MLFELIILHAQVAMAMADATTWPIGINLGTCKISSAYIPPNGEPVLVASIDGSQDYHNFMTMAALHDQNHAPPHQSDTAQQIFSDALRSIMDATAPTTELDPSLSNNITSVTIPDFLDNTENRRAVINACKATLSDSFTEVYKVRKLTLSARETYGLNTCEDLGLAPQCDLWNGSDVLFLDLNSHHLQVTLGEVVPDMVITADRVLSLALGAQQHAQDAAQWTRDVQRTLADFASRGLFDGQGRLKHRLAAIIISGEADTETIDVLKTVVGMALPNHRGIVRDAVAYQYVGAVGAAYWSKQQIDQPELFHIDASFKHIPDEL